MTYSLEVSPEFEFDYRKLCSKNRQFRDEVDSKIRQVQRVVEFNPGHYKPLKAPLSGLRRVHIGSFVLVFEVLEKEKTVRLLKLAHHDEAYGT